MSLLDDEDEPFVESPSRSYTREPLYDDRAEGSAGDESHRAREKKDKKKLDDRKSSTKAMPWSKSSTEKTPKKSKHHRTKSGSPPPISPKGRGQEQRKLAKGTGSQIHPSPNVKSQRKRYVQLGLEAGSSSEGEVDLETEGGFLLSNQPALSQHDDAGDVMESLGARLKPSTETTTGSPKQTKGLSFFDQETSEAHLDAWWPQPSKPVSPRRMTYSPGASLGQRNIAEAFLPHTGMSLPASSNPLLGEITGFSPQQQQPTSSLFGQSTAVAPPHQPASSLAPPTQSWPGPPAQEQSSKEPDWMISNDLRQKCIQQFNDLNPMEGRLQGDKAREFFVQSKLPNQELSAIWRLSDTDKDNALSETEFCIAMKLVLMRRKGFEIPTALPDSLHQHQHEQNVEKQIPQGKSDRGRSEPTEIDANTVTPAEPLHSDLSGSVPTKREDTEEILVEIGNQDSDTGLLVDVNGGISPTSSPPPPEPAVARIISIDTSWDTEEDAEDTALVSGSQPKSDEDPSSPSRQKPARPAPPKPSPRRSKTVKERPGLPPRPSERRHEGDGGSSSPPAGQASEAQSLLIIDSRQKSKSVRVSSKSPGTSRKDYSILGESSSSALDSNGQPEEKHGGSKVRWKNNVHDEDHNGDREDKGHARSTSLDLNKMLLAGNLSDVLEDLPSAEPPKPPPKPFNRASTTSDHESGSPTKEEPVVPRARVRALSTGSIDSSHTHEEPVSMETSTDALLLSGSKPHPPPKPKRKAPLVPPSKPQRPPPPSKPTGTEQLHTKDKAEVQAHIRSLKENNSALTEINGHLEDKLFKLIEERVRLAKQLKQLQLMQQQQQMDNQQQ